MKNLLKSIFIIAIFSGISSCKKEDDPQIEPLKDERIPRDVRDVYSIMGFAYLWASQAIEKVDIDNLIDYTEPISLMEDMKVEEDRFTYIEKGREVLNFLEGTPTDNGIILRYLDDTLYIAYVEPNSPADMANLQRGYWLKSINGIMATPNPGNLSVQLSEKSVSLTGDLTLIYTNSEGEINTVNLSPTLYNVETVSYREVKEINNIKIAYLVFSAFGKNSSEELNEDFKYFKDQNVSELILDLRYNGGGFVSVAQKLASLVTSESKGEILSQQLFNPYFTEYVVENIDEDFREDNILRFLDEVNSLNLQRIFILTQSSTASASEVVINGLRPFIDVKLIGKNTAGKNVGSLVYELEEHTFLPIMFRIVNARNFNDYAEGFKTDFSTYDNVKFPLGNAKENMLFQALYYIENDKFLEEPLRIAAESQKILTSNPIHSLNPLLSERKFEYWK